MTNYLNAAERVLYSIEVCCDEINELTDADIDNIRNGDALTLNFPNGTQIIVNLQKPIEEIWVAAQAGGYHFTLNEQKAWQERREGLELYGALTRFASEQAGMVLTFKEQP